MFLSSFLRACCIETAGGVFNETHTAMAAVADVFMAAPGAVVEVAQNPLGMAPLHHHCRSGWAA